MRIGFALPQFGRNAHQIDRIAGFAAWAEDAGAESLFVGDRLLAAVDPKVGYSGAPTIPDYFNSLIDPFVLLSLAATATSRVTLGTSVLNAPWYPPALLGRTLTSIDQLSNGRLLLGLGIGWSPEEFEAAGVPMTQRGARLDECLDGLHAWWTQNPVSLAGEHWTIPASHVELKPVRTPPVYLAGFAERAVHRVARRADGWLPVHRPGPRPLDPQRQIIAPLERIRGLAVEEYGRSAQDIGVFLRLNPAATATVADIVDAMKAAEQEAGVAEVFVDLQLLAPEVADAQRWAGEILDAAR